MKVIKALTELAGRLDGLLFAIVNGKLHASPLDSVMLFLSKPGTWLFVLCGLAGVYWLWKGGRKGRVAVALLMVTVACTDPVSVRIFKPAVARARPNHPDYLVAAAQCVDGYNGSYSYPSAHATNMFGAAGVLAVMYPSSRWIWVVVACAVAYSRVYLAQHFPADVFGGALLGLFIAGSWCRAARRLVGWKDKKK